MTVPIYLFAYDPLATAGDKETVLHYFLDFLENLEKRFPLYYVHNDVFTCCKMVNYIINICLHFFLLL